MDTQPQGDLHHPLPDGRSLNRRGFLRGAALAGGGLVVAGVAACSPVGKAGWTFPAVPSSSPLTSGGPSGGPSATSSGMAMASPPGASPIASPSSMASATPSAPMPVGWSTHDVAAKAAVDRFLGGEYAKVSGAGNQPLAATIAGNAKVFDLTIDRISHRIDAMSDPVDALGYDGTWPGPIIRVTEGDLVRATFTNNLDETTGVHFHGQHLPNAMDGVPFITQPPIVPGASFTYEFVAQPSGSHMYHSHHNATDQVGRGLLGAFIVEPKDPKQRYAALYGVTQEVVWISNDEIGGFTINGRGFPATAPIVAKKGEKVLIRFMNEGLMTHPWHLHGMHFQVVARDGWPLGSAAFRCDTLGVNPGERYDVVVDCDNPGAWAFHCHVLTHAESQHGMFGMVTALIVS